MKIVAHADMAIDETGRRYGDGAAQRMLIPRRTLAVAGESLIVLVLDQPSLREISTVERSLQMSCTHDIGFDAQAPWCLSGSDGVWCSIDALTPGGWLRIGKTMCARRHRRSIDDYDDDGDGGGGEPGH